MPSERAELGEPAVAGARGAMLNSVSDAMVKLHKEQFGRGPVHSRSAYLGDDTLVCTLEDALLPAERALVDMGYQGRVMEARMFLQLATRSQFIDTVESIVGRKVAAFSSATDADAAIVWEIFTLEA
jgi:uncharacterized protein YbcI